MKIKTLQWNIGGAKVRNEDDDPMDPLVYRFDALAKIIDILKEYNPDIITIQESHSDENSSQAEVIAKSLGLDYVADDVYEESHIESEKGLDQAIISRFPIEKHNFTFFYNPKLETLGPKGEHWVSHEKGVTSCLIKLGHDLILNMKTSHSFPYRRFNVEPLSEQMLELRGDMAEKLKPEAVTYLYQGDLNYNEFSLQSLLPELLQNGVQEVILNEPTTPKGRKYDHVVYRGLRHLSSKVVSSVLTDHFPIISEFEID
ncbi:MAG: endonuclease/exonuclease/phosphatase family protein [Candidatus Pacebacteria bacterium]|nr:endonuclease/exonuclease/phosphatase family protein [Candidatus Paceibacterota bacterium]